MIVPAIMLIILGYIDCTQPGAAVTLLVLGVSLTGFQYSGWVVNHMDIAPAFAGILFGISNSIAAVTGFLSPVVVNVITKVGNEDGKRVLGRENLSSRFPTRSDTNQPAQLQKLARPSKFQI